MGCDAAFSGNRLPAVIVKNIYGRITFIEQTALLVPEPFKPRVQIMNEPVAVLQVTWVLFEVLAGLKKRVHVDKVRKQFCPLFYRKT